MFLKKHVASKCIMTASNIIPSVQYETIQFTMVRFPQSITAQ